MLKKIKIILTQKKVNFRDAYEALQDDTVKMQFRHAIMASNKWQTKMSFYNAIYGKAWLSTEQIHEIRNLLVKMGTSDKI